MQKIGPVRVYRVNAVSNPALPRTFDSLIEAVCYYGYNMLASSRILHFMPDQSIYAFGIRPAGLVFMDEFGAVIRPSVVLSVADTFASADGTMRTRWNKFKRKRQHYHWGSYRKQYRRSIPIKRHHVSEAAWETDLYDMKDLDVKATRRHQDWHRISWYEDRPSRGCNRDRSWKTFRKTQWKEV